MAEQNYPSNIIEEAFKDLIFTKMEIKNRYAIYGAGISSGLAGGIHRYVLVFVPEHLSQKPKAKIWELSWENVQTRQLSYSWKLRPQSWNLSKNYQDVMLSIVKRTAESSTYASENIPFEIVLLHDPKKKTQMQYHNKLFLSAALNTFQCVVNYKEEIKISPTTKNWFTLDQEPFTLL